MDDPVNDRYRNIVIVEKLPPTGEVLIGSQDDGSVLVQAVDQLKQVVAGLASTRLRNRAANSRPNKAVLSSLNSFETVRSPVGSGGIMAVWALV